MNGLKERFLKKLIKLMAYEFFRNWLRFCTIIYYVDPARYIDGTKTNGGKKTIPSQKLSKGF
jgi:hypothetical protein